MQKFAYFFGSLIIYYLNYLKYMIFYKMKKLLKIFTRIKKIEIY